MSDFTPDIPPFTGGFRPFDGRVWLNCAHQGPLPIVAVDALAEAVRWKQAPYELTAERFSAVPERLRNSIANLIGAEPNEIVLGNSASYGLRERRIQVAIRTVRHGILLDSQGTVVSLKPMQAYWLASTTNR